MKIVVVTGASGFVGEALCELLSNNGIRVYAVSRKFNPNINILHNHKGIIPVICDMDAIGTLPDLIQEDVDVFFHLAWGGVSGQARGDYSIQIKNIEWVMKAVEAAHELGCKRFVGIGSTAETDVYNYSNLDESTPNLVSLYGAAKISSRLMSKALCNALSIDHIWATLGNTYGETDTSTNFVNFAYNLLLSNEPARFTAGEQLYDFVYVDDIANGLKCIGERGKKNCNYYIGSGHPQKLKEFLIEIRNIVNPDKDLLLGAIPFNGTSATIEQFDCTKLINDTGYYPMYSFEDGIRRLHESRSRRENQK